MSGSFDAAERRQLQAQLREQQPMQCPHCSVELVRVPVHAPKNVSYVRHRVQVICPSCRRTASLDEKPAP